jgi:transcriptional regulator with XRE-family HTH domain
MGLNALGTYARQRAQEIELSMAELARRAGLSRQTLHTVSNSQQRLPEMDTLVRLAVALRVHPLRLIHLAFEHYQLPPGLDQRGKPSGDASVFVADVTIPDGTLVMPGAMFTKIWSVQNIGSVAWEGRRLACADEAVQRHTLAGEPLPAGQRLRPLAPVIEVPTTPPGAVVQLAVEFQAPRVPGSYVSYWKSQHPDGSLCFPQSTGLSCAVQVVSLGGG